MDLREVTEKDKQRYNSLVTHVMQSWEWGEFREKLNTRVKRYGLFEKEKMVIAFQITFHPIPFSKKYIGYLPKGPFPSKELADALIKIGRDENCAFIKAEPHIEISETKQKIDKRFQKSSKPYFTKYNFVLDLTPSEEELLKNMHPKTRYNVRLAEKKGVEVREETSEKALRAYLDLYFATTLRQGYLGHNEHYHKTVFELLKQKGMARILVGYYKKKALTTWMLFNFKDTLYYPYGGSSSEHRDVMHSNLVAWEAIKLGKKMGLKKFDMWGALGPNADAKDPWFGFHRFKQGYGGKLEEYLGTYDLIFDRPLYQTITYLDRSAKLKAFLLRLVGR